MKNRIKILFMTTFIIFVFTMFFTNTHVNAANTKKLILYVGEVNTLHPNDRLITKVKSTKKSVVSVEKKEYGDIEVHAKKTGKATLKVDTQEGTVIYKVTVKKLKFSVKSKKIPDSNDVLISLKNNSGSVFNTVNAQVIFYNDQNEQVYSTKLLFNDLGVNQTAYKLKSIYDDEIDYSKTKCVVKIKDCNRTLTVPYVKYDKKVKFNIKDNGSKLKVTSKCKFTKKMGMSFVYVYYDIAFYDQTGKLIELKNDYIKLYYHKTKMTFSIEKPDNAASFKLLSKRIHLLQQ